MVTKNTNCSVLSTILQIKLKIETVDFQLSANSRGMENKLKLPCKKTLIVL